MRARFPFLLACALASGVFTDLRAQVVVVPNAVATTDGPTDNTAPKGPAKLRLMQLFDASQFSALSGPSFLTQLALRPDKAGGLLGPRTQTLRIYASTTTRPIASMSTTFSENIGTNNTLVFDGTWEQATANLAGDGNTRQFDILLPFATPFLYDPAAGNLVLDIQISSDDGEALRLDAVTVNDSAVRSLFALGSSTASSGSPAGSVVNQFTFEPSSRVTIRPSQAEICWNSQSNLTYQVQYRSALTSDPWADLGTCVRGTGADMCVQDAVLTNQPKRFYRVALANCVPSLPFKGSLEGTETPSAPDQPARISASGAASQIGRFSFTFEAAVSDDMLVATGTLQFIAANGDKILGSFTGKATSIELPIIWIEENVTITGGTGQFANATGSFIMTRFVDVTDNLTVGSFEGVIWK